MVEAATTDAIDIAEARRDPRRGPLRPREDQAAHPRVPRGAQAQPAGPQPDPVLRRPARRRQDLARPEHRARASGASSCASAWAACTTRPRSAATAAPISARCPATSSRRIRKAGTRNPVLMLDEMDKLGAGFHGDPSSALLEVLDPEQNSTFRDNYLGVPFDLSQVLFIATANVLDTIPGPLRDRMEVIELPGYTEDEKVEIARRYLVRRQLEANGLTPEQADDHRRRRCARSSRDYTREAGVRNLEREIGAVLRNVAVRIAEGAREQRDDRRRRPARDPRARRGSRTRSRCAPACRAWRPASPGRRSAATSCSSRRPASPASGKLILTGQLGDVMKESAQAALQPGQVAARRARHRRERCSRRATSTSTCRPARSRRTARARAWRCSPRWPRC